MRPPSLDALSRWAPVAAYAALIFWLSGRSQVPGAVGFVGDKAAHGLLYAGLAALVARALTKGGALNTMTRWVLAVALASLYGASDELHQMYVPARSADAADWAADTAGAALGAAVYLLLLGRTRGHGPNSRG